MTPTAYASKQGDINLFKFLLSIGFDINQGSSYNYMSPLHAAVKFGKKKMVKFLLENNADPYITDHTGKTAFFEACQSNRRHILKLLLNTVKPDKNHLEQSDDVGYTLLHYVALNGWIEIAEDLIETGIDVNRTDPKGFTALYYADCKGHKEIVHRLAKEGGLARWLTRPKLYRCPWVMRGRHSSFNKSYINNQL